MRAGGIIARKGDGNFTFVGATADKVFHFVSTTKELGSTTETDAESADKGGFASTCREEECLNKCRLEDMIKGHSMSTYTVNKNPGD